MSSQTERLADWHRQRAAAAAARDAALGRAAGVGGVPAIAPSLPAAVDTETLFIAVPAWTTPYVELAVRYTVPAALASLRAAGRDRAKWLICTDQPDAFRTVLDGQPIEFSRPRAVAGRDGHWVAFKQAHKDAITRTPAGAMLALLNSDVVISRETFAVVADAFAAGRKVVVSVGIRTLIEGNVCPVGVDAEELSRWIWSHRHPITEECIWGSGHTRHPTILFFPDGDAVSMHCFHLTPMFLVKDRGLRFAGTIDDDMLENYREDELYFVTGREFAVAELSPRNKHHPNGGPLSVGDVLDFGHRRFRPSHIRNFRHRYKVLGEPARDHPAAAEIIAKIGR